LSVGATGGPAFGNEMVFLSRFCTNVSGRH
jgi:hypothetical protein